MNRRQELCRYYQRGSCKYGARCRYVHASPHQQQQQQAKPNPFGFGAASNQQQQFGAQSQQQFGVQSQQQQQKPNPFGFGAASSQQQQFGALLGVQSQQQQQKPNPFGFGAASSQQQQFGALSQQQFGVQSQQQQQKSNPFGFGAASSQQQQFGAQSQQQFGVQSQQQQQKPNAFGFGAASRSQQQFGAQSQQQLQQQKPNPYGFGAQGSAVQSRDDPGPEKPFQNKLVRDRSAPTKHTEAQPPPQAAHTSYTDPKSCRQQISDDFKNEAPLWKLTCYAHLTSGPCDIAGGVSYEELRSKACEVGKQGHPLQSIVERERNLQNAKLMEFTDLLNSTLAPQTPSFPTAGHFPRVKGKSLFGGSQINGPPVFSSFSQIGAANFGSGSRITTPGVPTNTLFGQSTQSSPSFAAPTFGTAGMEFGVQDAFGSPISSQPFGSLQGSRVSSTSNFPKSPTSSAHHRDIDRKSLELLNGMTARTSTMDQAPVEERKHENQDDIIWLTGKWAIGEIPLDEPPQRHIELEVFCPLERWSCPL